MVPVVASGVQAVANESGKPPCHPIWILASLKILLRIMFDNPLEKPALHANKICRLKKRLLILN